MREGRERVKKGNNPCMHIRLCVNAYRHRYLGVHVCLGMPTCVHVFCTHICYMESVCTCVCLYSLEYQSLFRSSNPNYSFDVDQNFHDIELLSGVLTKSCYISIHI